MINNYAEELLKEDKIYIELKNKLKNYEKEFKNKINENEEYEKSFQKLNQMINEINSHPIKKLFKSSKLKQLEKDQNKLFTKIDENKYFEINIKKTLMEIENYEKSTKDEIVKKIKNGELSLSEIEKYFNKRKYMLNPNKNFWNKK